MPATPRRQLAHRTSLYQFPWRANPVQGREDMEGSRRSLSLSSLHAGCLESGMWPRGASSPRGWARGPESRRGSVPAHRGPHASKPVPPVPPRGGHLMKPLDNPWLEVGKAVWTTLTLDPEVSGATPHLESGSNCYTARPLTSRPACPTFPEGPASRSRSRVGVGAAS